MQAYVIHMMAATEPELKLPHPSFPESSITELPEYP